MRQRLLMITAEHPDAVTLLQKYFFCKVTLLATPDIF